MGKIRVGNKQNSFLNGEWAGHVRKDWKRITAHIRRAIDKKIIKEDLTEQDISPKRREELLNMKFGQNEKSEN